MEIDEMKKIAVISRRLGFGWLRRWGGPDCHQHLSMRIQHAATTLAHCGYSFAFATIDAVDKSFSKANLSLKR
jgi:hypothetical protein